MVHVDYGIGRYIGMTKIEVGGVQREVLKIEYRDGVTLFVKLENLSQVQKYSGREGFQPPLSKIGGRDWRELKKKTKKSLLSIAEDLIKLYAQRRAVRGHAFSTDTLWQKEMEASFPYEDTPDQIARRRGREGRHGEPAADGPADLRATSATARPKSPCAPRSRPSPTASRWPCWCRRRFSPSSTTAPSRSASRAGR